MAEMVVIAGLVGVLIGWTVTSIWAGIELRQLRERLDLLGALLAELKQVGNESRLPPQTHDHTPTSATQFTNSTLVRSWWLGKQARRRKQEEE